MDPAQSYYRGISYRSAMNYHNLSTTASVPQWDPEAHCMDSTQAWFCRDLWLDAAQRSSKDSYTDKRGGMAWLQDDSEEDYEPKLDSPTKRDVQPEIEEPGAVDQGGLHTEDDADANAGSDYDAMPPEADVDLPEVAASSRYAVPNSFYTPARILINSRCVTTYAGVSHTKLARELFGEEDAESADANGKLGGKYVLYDWESAPDSFVCQEQR